MEDVWGFGQIHRPGKAVGGREKEKVRRRRWHRRTQTATERAQATMAAGDSDWALGSRETREAAQLGDGRLSGDLQRAQGRRSQMVWSR